MKFVLTAPSRRLGALRFEFVTFPCGDFHPRRYRVTLVLDGEDLGTTEVTFRFDWAVCGIADALRHFGLEGGYKVSTEDHDAACKAASAAQDFTVPLIQESICRQVS